MKVIQPLALSPPMGLVLYWLAHLIYQMGQVCLEKSWLKLSYHISRLDLDGGDILVLSYISNSSSKRSKAVDNTASFSVQAYLQANWLLSYHTG